MNNSLYEVEPTKAQIEHKEQIIVGVFILQYAEPRMLEVYYKFFNKFCDVKTFGELEMDTDSMYLAVVEKEQEHCIWLDLKTESKRLRSKECSDSFTAGPSGNLCPRMFYDKHKKHDKRDSGLFKDEFR